MQASMAQATVASGTLSVTDTDAGQAGFQAGTAHGAYGDLALNADGTDLHRRGQQPGHQALGNGDTLTETFTVKSADGTSATVTITINGSNDAAVISSSGDGLRHRRQQCQRLWQLGLPMAFVRHRHRCGSSWLPSQHHHGAYGDLALNADGAWTYTVANGLRSKPWAMATH